MNRPCLRYAMNPRTGLPELQAAPGVLEESERRSLAAELARHYNRLVAHGNGPYALRTRTRPRLAPDGWFRLRVEVGHPRLPTLVLTPWPAHERTRGLSIPEQQRESLCSALREELAGSLLLGVPVDPVCEEALAVLQNLDSPRQEREMLERLIQNLSDAGPGQTVVYRWLLNAAQHLLRFGGDGCCQSG